MQGRDYFGDIKPTRFKLDTTTSFIFDLDGDGKNDTATLFFQQTSWVLEIKSHKSKAKVWIFGDEAAKGAECYVEIARAFLTTEEKPLLLVAIEKTPSLGNEFYIFDIIHTARGVEIKSILEEKSAGWANSPVIIKPGFVEIQHFRGWTIAKYLWDGKSFVKFGDEKKEIKTKRGNK